MVVVVDELDEAESVEEDPLDTDPVDSDFLDSDFAPSDDGVDVSEPLSPPDERRAPLRESVL